MSFNNFRELLIKKAAGRQSLQDFIKIIRDDYLADYVVNTLIKAVSEPSKAMGARANAFLTNWASTMTDNDVSIFRDALAHHVGRHKAALKSGNHEAANQHLNKIVPLMHLAAKASQHSNNLMNIKYTPLEAWETNYTTTERKPNGVLKEQTKGLGRIPSPGSNREKNKRGVPDYRYLEMAPHEGHVDSKPDRHGAVDPTHTGGYPFENIQIGSPSDVDRGKAYLNIPEITEPVTQYEPHAFDLHPINFHSEDEGHIHNHDDRKLKTDTGKKLATNWADHLIKWDEHPRHQKWLNEQKEKAKSDPVGFNNIGTVKPPHHFDGIPLIVQPHKADAPAVDKKED